MDCSGCRAYLLAERALALLGQNDYLAAALLHRSELACFDLRRVNCCGVNTRSGQFMLHTKEQRPAVAVPVAWAVTLEALARLPTTIACQVLADD